MPRRAPDGQGVTEHRITLGNWERNLIAETKSDIEKTVFVAGLTAVAMPVSIVIGGGLLGYGLYRGLSDFSFGSDKIGDWWKGIKDRTKEQKESGYTEHTNIFGLPGWGLWPGVI